jgi:DNA polymerase-1
VGAQTGRLSSTEPNLQNIPIRTEIGRQIRDCFVAEPGNAILSADYSQIELRLAAHMADVPELKAAFAAGEDIHAATALTLFGEVDRETRGPRRSTSPSSMASAAGASPAPWRDARRSAGDDRHLFRPLPRHPALYPRNALQRAGEGLFADPLWPQMLVPAHQRQKSGRAAGQRTRRHQRPIQGTCADIIKRAMARMGPRWPRRAWAMRMLLQVHDELVFELPEGDVEAASAVIRA